MAERTEEDKLAQASLEVTLGGQVYEIKPLVIKDARPWRAKVSELMGSLSIHQNASSDNPEEFKAGLNAALVSVPDEVINLFFEYARDLDREEIEAVATDAEITEAFNQIIEIAFPLATSLGRAIQPPRTNQKVGRKRP